MSESTEGVYEMFWDCAFCGTTALLGVTNRHCPSCGARTPTADCGGVPRLCEILSASTSPE